LKFFQTKKKPLGTCLNFLKIKEEKHPQRYFRKLEKILKTFKHNPHGYFWKF
jgi:hypothetical protein